MVDKVEVVLLFHRAYPASFSTAMNAYSVHLARNGVQVTVIAAKQWGESLPDHEVLDGVEVYRIPTDLRTARSAAPTTFALKAFRLLDSLMRERSIDILHMLAFPNLGFVLYPVPFWSTPPVKVLDIRATAVSSSWADRFSRQVLRWQRRLFRHIIVLNTHVAEALFGSTKGIEIIPLGADFSTFRPGNNPALREQLGIGEDELVLIYVGNMHYPRRLDRLLLSFHLAARKLPHLRLLMVGGGSDWERLREVAQSLKLDDKVLFTGYVPYAEVPAYLRAADIGLAYVHNVAQYRDQPPIKTIEYLASGLPVVATNTLGNQDFIRHKWNGLLAQDDPRAFAEAIVRLAKDEGLRSALAMRARESVREYDYEHIVRHRLIPFYERCIEEYSARGRRK